MRYLGVCVQQLHPRIIGQVEISLMPCVLGFALDDPIIVIWRNAFAADIGIGDAVAKPKNQVEFTARL